MTMADKWRNGRLVGRTVYRGNELIGVMDTPELAALVASSVNLFLSRAQLADATPVTVLPMDTRTANVLLEAGITTVGELCQMAPSQLLKARRFGRKSLALLEATLADRGLCLRGGSR